jgi:DNA polymerase (family 10)
MDNAAIARVFDDVADLLEIQGANAFRIRAYRSAARTVESLGASVAAIVERDPKRLEELAGIGADLAGKICEIVRTGDLGLRRELASEVPDGVVQMMRLPSVGPKRAKLFWHELGVGSIAELADAARAGKLAKIRGVGETLQRRILDACIRAQAATPGRHPLIEADEIAAKLLAWLRAEPAVARADVAGSVRRRKETVGDIDVLAASLEPRVVADRFVAYPEVERINAHGETRSAVVLRSGHQVDLRVVAPETYGAALAYFTGSKAHNIAIRTLALERGLKVSEYGVFRGKRRIGGAEEVDVYRAVHLPLVPPELREGRGEIEAAAERRLPTLVTLSDVRGDLHVHTSASDGHDTIAAMRDAAAARGYAYVAITDHVWANGARRGLDRGKLREQAREIDRLNASLAGPVLLKGAEVDVLSDGTLALDDASLDELDVVVAAIHSELDMEEGAMTERILRALRHPRVAIFAHPTGRLIGSRPPARMDIPAVARAARDLGVFLEIDARPERLDLYDILVRVARDEGARLVVDSDAHRAEEIAWMRYGVDQARRGWCTAADVANTRSLAGLARLCSRLRAPAPPVAERAPLARARPRGAMPRARRSARRPRAGS